jgi:hypothetical protein
MVLARPVSLRALLRSGIRLRVSAASGRYRIRLGTPSRRGSLGQRVVRLRAGRAATFRVRPSAAARRWLRRTGVSRMRVTVHSGRVLVAAASVKLRR